MSSSVSGARRVAMCGSMSAQLRIKPSHAEPGHVKPGHVKPGYVRLGRVFSELGRPLVKD